MLSNNKNKKVSFSLLLFLTLLCMSNIVNVVVGQGQSGGGGGGGDGSGMGNGGMMSPAADGSNVCNICGEGSGDGKNFRPTNPDAIVSIPERGDVTCRQLAVGGANGIIPLENCPTIVELAKEPCGCAEFDGSTSNGGGGMMGDGSMGQQQHSRRPGNRQEIMGHMVSVQYSYTL